MVTDKHRAFARAVVALAREHDMDSLRLTFRLGFNARPISRESYEEVTMTWHTGRHGVAGSITLETRAQQQIEETRDVR